MFDHIHSSTESYDTLFNHGSTSDADPGFAAPLPDAGTLLAEAGGLPPLSGPALKLEFGAG